MGRAEAEFHLRICEIVCRHDDGFNPEEHVQHKHSSTGKYHSLTVNLRATSKGQIDAVYQELKACELVLWAL